METAAVAADETARRCAELEAVSAAIQDRADLLVREISGLETAITAAERRANDAESDASALRARIEALTLAASAAELAIEGSAKRIASLEVELEEINSQNAMDRERYHQVASDAALLEGLLRKERQSALEAMELLSRVQDKFSEASAGASGEAGRPMAHAADALDFSRRANGHAEISERA